MLKAVKIIVKVDDETGKIGNLIKTLGFKNNSIEEVLFIVGMLENLKAVQLQKLQNLRKESYG